MNDLDKINEKFDNLQRQMEENTEIYINSINKLCENLEILMRQAGIELPEEEEQQPEYLNGFHFIRVATRVLEMIETGDYEKNAIEQYASDEFRKEYGKQWNGSCVQEFYDMLTEAIWRGKVYPLQRFVSSLRDSLENEK